MRKARRTETPVSGLTVTSRPSGRRKRAEPATPAALTGDEIVLVVDDDENVRHALRTSLECYGYTVYEASNGEMALSLSDLFSAPPDLILTDLVMPEVSGRELIAGLKGEGKLTKVLLMSGHQEDQVLERSTPVERYPFIRKPFSHRDLALSVRQVLDANLV